MPGLVPRGAPFSWAHRSHGPPEPLSSAIAGSKEVLCVSETTLQQFRYLRLQVRSGSIAHPDDRPIRIHDDVFRGNDIKGLTDGSKVRNGNDGIGPRHTPPCCAEVPDDLRRYVHRDAQHLQAFPMICIIHRMQLLQLSHTRPARCAPEIDMGNRSCSG